MLACGVTIDADAINGNALETIRTASWVIASVASLWCGIVTMVERRPGTENPFELRMLIERNSRMGYAANTRMGYAANTQSMVCATVTLAIVVAMLR